MNRPFRQRGMTLIGWLLVLMTFGFLTLLALKVGPIYMENFTVTRVLKQFEGKSPADYGSSGELIKKVSSSLYINEIRRIKEEDIIVKKSDGKSQLAINYVVRENIFKNLDVIVTFSNSVALNN